MRNMTVQQDGGVFYALFPAGWKVVADYSNLVKGDFDMEGAKAARRKFRATMAEADVRVTFM